MINPHEYQDAVDQVIDEVDAAIQKHGNDFERANFDKKLRIMVEEVGEISGAIQEIEEAYARIDDERARLGVTSAAAANAVVAAEQHLRAEIAQVGACALRWLRGES